MWIKECIGNILVFQSQAKEEVMIQLSKPVTFTSLFSGVQAMAYYGKAQLAKWVAMPLIFAIIAVMPATVSAFECSTKLDSCSNKKEICDAFKWASMVSAQQCLNKWNTYKGTGNSTCNNGIRDTYYSCIKSK